MGLIIKYVILACEWQSKVRLVPFRDSITHRERIGEVLGEVLVVIESGMVLPCFTGRAGVPMEVMGLMLGEFVDDYTVRVIDVFAMPQSGTVS